MNTIDRISKLPPTKALIYCLLVAIGWFANRLDNNEDKDEIKVEQNEKKFDKKDHKIDSLTNALIKMNADCSEKLQVKDEEIKDFLRAQLAEGKAARQKALNAEKKVDATVNQTITRLTNEIQIQNQN